MTKSIRFSLVLHNHQPIGNFDHVFEQAYQDSYLPFLDVFEPYEHLRIALHTSGPLMEWLDSRHPEYLDRLRHLVAFGRIEIVGGAFYEPILTMIPSRDRVGQIRSYTHWLESRLGGEVGGMWVPERVWEQSIARDLVAANIRYTLLDDFHFKNGGLTEDQLYGYYLTEDDGQTLSVLPGSEELRYLIPFQAPEETIAYLGRVSEKHPGAFVVFGDDGEKFGTWPETKQHVYDNGWLQRFFDLLTANKDWIDTTTPTAAMQQVQPLGKTYLPEGSYREMTEWALPAQRQLDYNEVRHDLQDATQWSRVSQFVHGGFWRNFKVRYPESNEMYARMMQISERLAEVTTAEHDPAAVELFEQARTELYRAQCNCSYWHGAFGGIYLPHLRNAVFRHLILADTLLEQASARGDAPWCEISRADFNFDGNDDIQLASDRLIAFVEPNAGGRLYELDVRDIAHNLLATLARRPEAYHEKVLAGPSANGEDVSSIHDRVVFKQEGLDKLLQYDKDLRKSLVDHFYHAETSLDDVVSGQAEQIGDFSQHPYEAATSCVDGRAEVMLRREGRVGDQTITITKRLSLAAGSSLLDVVYLVEGLSSDHPLHFAVEWNFAGLPAGADDRYYYDADHNRLGQLGTQLDLHEVTGIGLVDEWLGIDVGLSANRPTSYWTYPIATVSQSEGGFEAVHQSVVVMPHWLIQGDEQGRWATSLQLSIDTSRAAARRVKEEVVAAGM